MSFMEDLWSLLPLQGISNITRSFSGSLVQSFTDSMNNSASGGSEEELCRDDSAAFLLKIVAIASMFTSGVVGIAIPLVGKHRRFLRTDGNLFVAAKAFAAGVILATGFVHMLSDGSEALDDPNLPDYPWSKFPFPSFFAMLSALLTLLVDFLGTQYYAWKQEITHSTEEQGRVASLESGIVTFTDPDDWNGNVIVEGEGGGIHIVGMHAHAARHGQSHPRVEEVCHGTVKLASPGNSSGHSHGIREEVGEGVRHVIVSQVLELGIVSHSIIIGLSLGVSQSPCTIRPLTAALSFHQFFEGFALGGCISQAQFNTLSSITMAGFFASTTPVGIGLGAAVSSIYNPHSSGAIITEGILDCLSAGILIYTALVDLIAADFLSKRMSCNFRLQLVSYGMLFLGAGLMSSLAIWA